MCAGVDVRRLLIKDGREKFAMCKCALQEASPKGLPATCTNKFNEAYERTLMNAHRPSRSGHGRREKLHILQKPRFIPERRTKSVRQWSWEGGGTVGDCRKNFILSNSDFSLLRFFRSGRGFLPWQRQKKGWKNVEFVLFAPQSGECGRSRSVCVCECRLLYAQLSDSSPSKRCTMMHL